MKSTEERGFNQTLFKIRGLYLSQNEESQKNVINFIQKEHLMFLFWVLVVAKSIITA